MKRKRKPDLFAVLAIVVALGVLASSLAQGMLTTTDSRTVQMTQHTLQQNLQTSYTDAR